MANVYLTPYERDRAILEMRKRGHTYRAIGRAVGMSPSSVLYAWRRLTAGGPGTRPRHWGESPRRRGY
jgi:hypothetical protein